MRKSKPKILIITGGYLPGKKFGGITTSRKNLADGLSEYYEVVVITKNHDYKETVPYENILPGWNQVEGVRVLYLADRECTEANFSAIIKEEQPEIIYTSGTITSYFGFNNHVFAAARKNGVPVITTPDGDMCKGALRNKRLKKIAAISICRLTNAFKGVYFQTTSEDELKCLQKYMGIEKKRIFAVPNFPHKINAREDYKKVKNNLHIVYLSRIHKQKNLALAINAVNKAKAHVVFDIFGPIEDYRYWTECKKVIARRPSNVSITYKGEVLPGNACEVLVRYDCMILPTVSENYCYTIEESLTSGCPVIISKGTTPWDDLDGKAGYTVNLENENEFADRINDIANMNTVEYNNLEASLVKYVASKINAEGIARQYQNMFNKLC